MTSFNNTQISNDTCSSHSNVNELMTSILKKANKEDFDIILDTFENQTIANGKYQVAEFIDKGENGSVYKVK